MEKNNKSGRQPQDISHLPPKEQAVIEINRLNSNVRVAEKRGDVEKADELREQLLTLRAEYKKTHRKPSDLTANARKYRNTANGKEKRRAQSRKRLQKPEAKARQKFLARSPAGKYSAKITRLNQFNNRFKAMKEKDPTMKDMDDVGLKYLTSELALLIDEDRDPQRRDAIAKMILPYTSRAKPMQVEHSGEVTHTQLVEQDAMQRLERLLKLDDPKVVMTVPQEEDSEIILEQ